MWLEEVPDKENLIAIFDARDLLIGSHFIAFTEAMNRHLAGLAKLLLAGLADAGDFIDGARWAVTDACLIHIQDLPLHLVGGWLAANLWERLAQGLSFCTLGDLPIGTLRPHGIRSDALFLAPANGVVLLPELFRSELDNLSTHDPAFYRDLAPCWIGHIGAADLLLHVGAELG